MTDHDYEEVGFKAGLEIHQQLAGDRLFSRTPAVIVEREPDYVVRRRLRASKGESGAVDIAASHEQHKQKTFVYQGFHDVTSLVELDEEPVSSPGERAVETAVMTAKLFDMLLVDEVHVMRKVVVDGSNTSGFQRTMMVATGGKVRDVRLDRICLEEDSCKIVSRGKDEDVYNLSRLGIPLLEITTLPDITSPKHLQQIAGEIGMVLRSTGRVKRGLGTIRQDVNVSVARGSRVEIKGVQDFDLLPVIADNEVSRQLGLADLADVHDSVSVSDMQECGDAFASAKGWVRKALDGGDSVLGGSAKDWSGVFGKELFSGFRVGTELAGYAKAWGFGGIIHSDEDPGKYGLDSWDSVREALGASEDDACVLLVGDAASIRRAWKLALKPRIQQFCVGVPSEVRKALDDGSSTYLRPMPGAARMYPETDVRPFSVSEVSVDLPELLSRKIPRIAKQHNVSFDVASVLCRLGRDQLFERWAGKLPASLVADVLAVKEKELKKRHGVDVDVEEVCEELFERLARDEISKDAIEDVLLSFAKHGSVDWDRFRAADDSVLVAAVEQAISKDPDAPFGALMGSVMEQLGGKADGKRVSELLRERLK